MSTTQPTLMPPAQKDVALVPTNPASEMIGMIERLAKDVDVDKLERLIGMQERVLASQAKASFDAAFARMQPELPEITERGAIKKRDGTVQSTYAKLEDIQAAIKPVLKTHGFSIRHRTEWPQDRATIIRIVGILSHEHGHSEESVFEAPMDRSDYRSDIQSMGSTVSYGRRYTTLDLLNITTRGADDDGQKAGRPREESQAPQGYGDWLSDLLSTADSGFTALTSAWNASRVEFRNYLLKTDKEGWNATKAKAQDIDKRATR